MALERTSGKNGSGSFKGNDLGNLTEFNLTREVDEEARATSSTGGEKDHILGNSDTTGDFTMAEQPTFNVGDEGTLVLNYESGNAAYNGQAGITSVQKSASIEDGTTIVWQVGWVQKVSGSTAGS